MLLIGGRAGVGRTTAGWEVPDQLREAGIAHAIVEVDYLGQVHPPPADDPHCSAITEADLAAVWRNYVALGHHRLIYTDTVSVLPGSAAMFERAMGPGVGIGRALLTASDATAPARLSAREIGSALDREVAAVRARPGSWTSTPSRTRRGWPRTAGRWWRSPRTCWNSRGGGNRTGRSEIQRRLHRQQGGGPLPLPRADRRVHLAGQGGDIADGHGPLVGVPPGGLPGEPELERAVRERVQGQIALGIPLDACGADRSARFQAPWSSCTSRT